MNDIFDEDTVNRWPAIEKWEYRTVFSNSDGELDALPRLDFFAAAKASVERLASYATVAEIEGMAALYLFRHYLELTLKDIVFGCRSLKDKNENSPAGAATWPTGHDLQTLWNEAKKQIPVKLGTGVWPQWDHDFVSKCIAEFHAIDSSSERLRYRWTLKHGIQGRSNPVRVSWAALCTVMQHTHDVLEAMDSYLVETHAQNSDWQDEMNSWV